MGEHTRLAITLAPSGLCGRHLRARRGHQCHAAHRHPAGPARDFPGGPADDAEGASTSPCPRHNSEARRPGLQPDRRDRRCRPQSRGQHAEVSSAELEGFLRNVFSSRDDKTLYIIGDGTLRYGDIVPGHRRSARRRCHAGWHRHRAHAPTPKLISRVRGARALRMSRARNSVAFVSGGSPACASTRWRANGRARHRGSSRSLPYARASTASRAAVLVVCRVAQLRRFHTLIPRSPRAAPPVHARRSDAPPRSRSRRARGPDDRSLA